MDVIGTLSKVLRRQVGNTTYYYGHLSSDKLKDLTFVPVIEASTKTFLNEETEGGYQRPASHSRMRAFKKFLEANPDSVVPPILLSGRGHWEFSPSGSSGDFGDLVVRAPAAIVDGQHRAGGYVLLFEGDGREEGGDARNVDFILINEKDLDREMKEFTVVNSTQRGVPKPLTEYLSGSEEASIAWELNTREDSPFKERITRTKLSKSQLFALHSVAKEIRDLFSHGSLEDLTTDEKIDALISYWVIIADERPVEWSDIEALDDPTRKGRGDFEFKMLELTGFIAWSRIGKQILSRAYSSQAGMNWDRVRKLVRLCGNVDWRKNGEFEGLTGAVGGPRIVKVMESLLKQDPAACHEENHDADG